MTIVTYCPFLKNFRTSVTIVTISRLFFKKKCDYSHKSYQVFKKAGNSSADLKIVKNYGKSHVKVKISCDYSHNLIAILKKVGKISQKWRFSNCSNSPQNHRTENFLCSTETRGVGASIGVLTGALACLQAEQ